MAKRQSDLVESGVCRGDQCFCARFSLFWIGWRSDLLLAVLSLSQGQSDRLPDPFRHRLDCIREYERRAGITKILNLNGLFGDCILVSLPAPHRKSLKTG